MFTQEQIIEAVQTVLKDHKEEQEKHPSPSWPASSMQDAVEAADAEALDHGIRYGLDLLLQNLGIPEFVSQHLVGLQDSLKEAEFIKREYPELYQRYQEKGLIDQLSEAVGQ